MELPVVVGRPQPLTQAEKDLCDASGCSNSRGISFTVTFKTQPTAGAELSLVFRNFYAATLRVVQINSDGSSHVLVDEFALMQHVQYEDDAQKWHVFALEQLQVHDSSFRLDHLRVFCFQPCPLWASFELQQVKVFSQPIALQRETSTSDQKVLSPRQKGLKDIVQTRPVGVGPVQQTALHLLTLLQDVRKLLHRPLPPSA